jgi:hypothetical protein
LVTPLRSAVTTPALFVLLVLTPIAAAGAQEVSTAEFANLVDSAHEDPGATSQLRKIESIDGFETDMDQIIDGSTQERQDRLSSLDRLLDDVVDAPQSADELRAEANDIISEPPFSAEKADGAGWLDQFFTFVARILTGEGVTGLALVLVAVVAIAVATPTLLRMARARGHQETSTEVAEAPEQPNYAKAAARAEAQGEFDDAVRLLFLDGVDHLERIEVVRSAATTSTATVRRLSTETEFLDRFDEIAYGGVPAQADDVNEARTAWGRLKARRFSR